LFNKEKEIIYAKIFNRKKWKNKCLRSEANFRAQENLSACAKKFISVRKEILPRPYENNLSFFYLLKQFQV
jgi:hypothetical protein